MDQLGTKPLRKERYDGERYVWELREAQEHATRLAAKVGGEMEGDEDGEEGRCEKWTFGERRAFAEVERERRKRRLADL